MRQKLGDGGSIPAFVGMSLAAILIGIPTAAGIAQETGLPPPVPLNVKQTPINPHRNPNGSLKRGLRNQMITGNWSGYAVASFQTGQIYTSASATWQVPAVAYGYTAGIAARQFSAAWVGIGGYCEAVNWTDTNCTQVDPTLIQLGTMTQVDPNGSTQYYAWYELLPDISYFINFVNPGDVMTASLQCAAPCASNTTQSWTLSMTDETSNWTWTQNFSYQSRLESAEWILEAPYGSGVAPLDDFVHQTFDPVAANGASPTLSLATNGLIMEDPWGQTSNPSSPALGQWFSTCYGTGTTLISCTPGSFTPPPAASPPADTLTANPTAIASGQSSTLTWSSTNAASCSGNGFTASGTSGSATVSPIATTSYSVTCTGSGGSATAKATVTIGGVCHGNKKCG